MASSEVYKVVLSGGAPWGFRLQGGKEFRAPLRIAKITPGSKAQQANIYEGLYVQAINNYPSAELTHGDALNIVKKSGSKLELVLCWKPDSNTVASSSAGSYTTEDINRGTHVTRATFKPSSEAPSYATLPRGGQTWKGDVDENFNNTYVSEANSRSEWDPNIISNVTRPPEPIQLLTNNESIRSATSIATESSPYSEVRVHKGFEKPQPVGRGARRFDEPSHESYGYKPPLTSSVGSDEDFNMANGESSSQDSGPHYASINRPAMNQFRRQKVNAEIEATKDPKPLPKKVPPPPPAKPERRYPNILEQEKYQGPSRPAIKKGNKWYKEMFKEMHATAGASSNLSALLANDAAKASEEQREEDQDHALPPPPPPSDFIHPMHARPVESMNEESDYTPSYTSPHDVPQRPYVSPSPTRTQPVSPPGGHQQVNVPTWYQDMLKGEQIPTEEPLSYGIHKKQHSYDGDEVKHRFTGPHAPVHANRPPDYVAPLSRSAADRPMHKTVPTTVTVQQEERSKPPTATSMYESRFRGQVTPGSRSASEELGVKQKPPSDEDLIRKREEEARLRREEEERRRQEEEREMIRQQQEERQRREREAEQRRRKLEAEEAARKAADRPQFFAMALYNFEAQTPKELSFRKGDYIIVKRQIDRNWIEGELKGRVGIFPTNYVELRPIEDEEEETPVESPPSPYIPVEGEAKAKYNFRAESAREISVSKGEIVTLTRKVDQNWYEGISQGRKGILPAAYLEVLREPGLVPKASVSPKGTEQPRRQEQFRQEDVIRKTEMPKVSQIPQEVTEIRKTTTTTTTYDRSGQPTSYGEPIRVTHSGQPQMRGGPPQPQLQVKYISKEPEPSVLPAQVIMDEPEMFPLEGERFKAAFSYRPQNDDELPLEEGEEVIVLEKCDDGWFVGHSTSTGLFGTFPGNYVVALCKSHS